MPRKKPIKRIRVKASERRTPRATKKPTKAIPVVNERFRISPIVLRLTEDRSGVNVPKRIQLFRTGTFKKLMPDGKSIEFSITRETLEQIVDNFNHKIRGTDIALDFAHKSDEEAAGWFKSLSIEDDAKGANLFADIEWTTDGYAAVEGKKFRYLSPDFAFAWTDNETGTKYGATLFGAGLTNRPVIKHMAPTVELTEVTNMAKKTQKISELTIEELEVLLSETTDEVKKELIQLRLDEMSEDDDSDDGDSDDDSDSDDASDSDDDSDAPPAAKKKVKAAAAKAKPKGAADMNMDELKGAYQKVCDELADVKKGMAKSLAETRKKEKEAKFTLLLAEGKAVPAQKDAFMADDMVTFVELSEIPKFTTLGGHGINVVKSKTTAADEVLKLAEEAVAAKKIKKSDSISYVLSNNAELYARYTREMETPVGLEK